MSLDAQMLQNLPTILSDLTCICVLYVEKIYEYLGSFARQYICALFVEMNYVLIYKNWMVMNRCKKQDFS